ncbi:hypothetical protein ACX5I6_12260 [Arthrobacter sp. MMS24-T111]
MKHQRDAVRNAQLGQRWMAVAATASAIAAYCLLQVLPLMSSAGFSWRNFRNYFPYDQYSYLAIAVNVRDGNMSAVEPFTETGVNHYPRLYYIFLGLLSRIFSSDIIATWQITGLTFQLIMVGVISWLFIRLTGKPVMGVLGFLPSIIGTFAVPLAGNWFHALDNHAVLWGAFGVLFTLNGESAALSMAVVSACLLIGFAFPVEGSRRSLDRRSWAVIIGAAAAMGLLANVQTYSFLAVVYFTIYIVAVFGLISYGVWWHTAVSLVLLAVVILAGPTIAVTAGPLATLVVGVAAALPGYLLVLLRYKGPMLAAALMASVAASPTIVGTMLGLADKDEFLTYREVSSSALGVPVGTGLLAAIVPLLMLALIFWAGVMRRNRAWLAFSIGAGAAWTLVATNDRWGANQEPYRFWIDGFTLVTATAVPIVCQILFRIWNTRSELSPRPRSSTGRIHEDMPTSASDPLRPRTGIAIAWCAIVLGTLGISLLDYFEFSRYVHDRGTESFHNPQGGAIEQATATLTANASAPGLPAVGDGKASDLVLADPCINPFQLKTLTGLPTAFYNLGLAWPSKETSLREVLKQRSSTVFAESLAKDAGIKYVLTDSSCSADWEIQIHGDRLSEASYDTNEKRATVTLWKLTG